VEDSSWTYEVPTPDYAPTSELVRSRVWPAWVATGMCSLSAVFIPFGQLWPGYAAGVAASVVCMLAILDDRERQNSPNFARGAPVEQWARWVRVASFLVCLVHIVSLAQEAAK